MLTKNNKSILLFFISLLGLIFLFSCERETGIPVKADFSIKVVNEDYTVPVKVEITNLSTGAEVYEWEFEGAVVNSSNERNPKPITYTQAGVYKIKLKASNKDGNEDTKIIEVQIDAAMKVAFSWNIQGSNIAPVTLQMVNESLGATQYHWEFQNGQPATSNEENPQVTFSQEGTHLIKLTITNGKETYSVEKSIEVKPAMNIDFDWEVDFIDEDYQAPVSLFLKNKTTNAFSYEWTISGANPSLSTEENPMIIFPNAGTYTIVLKATNDKETKTLQKQITIHPNKNLLSFTNIKLGINTAHGSIGCFFSSQLGKVVKRNEMTSNIGNKIDFAFFGLNSSFNYNQFISPDEVQTTAFSTIPNATHTKIINSQELVGTQLTSTAFDAISLGSAFSSINITESNTGKTPFNNAQTPRVVLFQTADGRKGAIKIKNFVANGVNSYILTDIKVQKQPE